MYVHTREWNKNHTGRRGKYEKWRKIEIGGKKGANWGNDRESMDGAKHEGMKERRRHDGGMDGETNSNVVRNGRREVVTVERRSGTGEKEWLLSSVTNYPISALQTSPFF